MSQLLDQLARTDAQRSADLDASDAEMERLAADLWRLSSQDQRIARRIQETAQIERVVSDRLLRFA